jgi:hypothetical protein
MILFFKIENDLKERLELPWYHSLERLFLN